MSGVAGLMVPFCFRIDPVAISVNGVASKYFKEGSCFIDHLRFGI